MYKKCTFDKKEIMETSVRNELHKIKDESSDDKVQEMFDCLNNGMGINARYSPSEIQEFYNLLEQHEKGLTKSYTVAETLAIVRNRKRI